MTIHTRFGSQAHANTASLGKGPITVGLNGKPVQLRDTYTLGGLIRQCGLSENSCATAVNGQFVARNLRDDLILREGDQVMTFEPITGG